MQQFTDVVSQPTPQSQQEALEQDRKFKEKASKLSAFSDACARTSKMVAVGADTGNKKVAEALLSSAGQVVWSHFFSIFIYHIEYYERIIFQIRIFTENNFIFPGRVVDSTSHQCR